MKSITSIIIFIIGIGFGAFSYYYFTKPSGFTNLTQGKNIPTLAPVSETDAGPNIDAIRAKGAFLKLSVYEHAKTHVIIHDITTLYDYAGATDKSFFYHFTQTHSPKPGYVWQLGLYPMISKYTFQGNDNTPRLSIYFIPTMVKAKVTSPVTGPEVLDYYDIKNTDDHKYYIADVLRNAGKMQQTTEDFIYDTGEIWP